MVGSLKIACCRSLQGLKTLGWRSEEGLHCCGELCRMFTTSLAVQGAVSGLYESSPFPEVDELPHRPDGSSASVSKGISPRSREAKVRSGPRGASRWLGLSRCRMISACFQCLFFGIFLMTGGFRFGLRSGHGRLSDALGSDVYEASGIG